jgi:hypothetical protein
MRGALSSLTLSGPPLAEPLPPAVPIAVRIAATATDRIDARRAAAAVALCAAAGPDIERATHRLRDVVADADGRTLIESEPVEFHPWRASRLFTSRRETP